MIDLISVLTDKSYKSLIRALLLLIEKHSKSIKIDYIKTIR